MKWQHTLVAGVTALALSPVWAGDFTNLPGLVNAGPGTTTLVNGVNNQNSDRLYLDATSSVRLGSDAEVPTSISYNAIAISGGLPRPITGSGTLTLLDWRFTPDVVLAGEEIGNLYDFVFSDSRDNKLVFGTRVLLGVEQDQAQDAELNFVYRNGFTGFSAAAAWLYTGNSDLRMYNAGRTASNSLTGAVPYSPGTVRFQSDVNLSEGNPFSGLFLIKTDATAFTTAAAAVGVFQAGEEGQPRVGAELLGFVPAIAAVPEPATYALLLGGLGLVGLAARRRAPR